MNHLLRILCSKFVGNIPIRMLKYSLIFNQHNEDSSIALNCLERLWVIVGTQHWSMELWNTVGWFELPLRLHGAAVTTKHVFALVEMNDCSRAYNERIANVNDTEKNWLELIGWSAKGTSVPLKTERNTRKKGTPHTAELCSWIATHEWNWHLHNTILGGDCAMKVDAYHF